jgi:hypothetical protein
MGGRYSGFSYNVDLPGAVRKVTGDFSFYSDFFQKSRGREARWSEVLEFPG